MKNFREITDKILDLVYLYEVAESDTLKRNLQGMIEGLFWTIEENADKSLIDAVEKII